jgi:hypothetical protein
VLTNLRHAAFTVAPNFYFFCPTTVSILLRMCVCVCVCVCMYTHTRTQLWLYRDYIWITVATKYYCEWNICTQIWSGAKCFLDTYHWAASLEVIGRIHNIGQTFFSLFFKQEVVATPVTSKFSPLSHSSRRPLLDIIMIILGINDEKLRRYKSNWLRHATRMNNRMPKIMLNCWPNGRRDLKHLWKRLLHEVETGLSRPH